MTWRLFLAQIAGAFLIIGVAYGFLVSEPLVGRAEAATVACKGRLVVATWYGAESGNKTASGAYFDGSQLLVAHRTLKLGTKVRVTFRGKSVVVPVLDRGPAKWTGAEIDLSHAVAKRIGFLAVGKGKVCLEVVK